MPGACLFLLSGARTHLPMELGCYIPTTPVLLRTPSCCQKVFLAALFIWTPACNSKAEQSLSRKGLGNLDIFHWHIWECKCSRDKQGPFAFAEATCRAKEKKPTKISCITKLSHNPRQIQLVLLPGTMPLMSAPQLTLGVAWGAGIPSKGPSMLQAPPWNRLRVLQLKPKGGC